jgi:hypothetical protein
MRSEPEKKTTAQGSQKEFTGHASFGKRPIFAPNQA